MTDTDSTDRRIGWYLKTLDPLMSHAGEESDFSHLREGRREEKRREGRKIGDGEGVKEQCWYCLLNTIQKRMVCV
jgi:hypothetical protein